MNDVLNGELAASGVELRHLRALVALAVERHYGRAALRLHLAQSTLSRTIVDLEGLVGTVLVDRDRRGVALTDGGRALVGVAEQTLAAVQRGVAAARTAPLTLGVMGAYGFRWIPALQDRLGPDMCAVRPIAPDEGFDALERDVTLAVTAMPIVEPAHLIARPLARTDRWVALAHRHPLAEAETVPFERLAREPLLLPAVHATLRANVELVFRAHGLTVRRGPETSCPAELLALVAAGAGWSLATTREELQPWDGVALRRVAGLDRTTIALVCDPARVTAQAQHVIDTLVEIAADETGQLACTGSRSSRSTSRQPTATSAMSTNPSA